MLGADVIVVQMARLLHRELDRLFGSRRLRQLAHGGDVGPALNQLFDFEADFAYVDVQVLQDIGRHAAAFLDQAQQDVLGADVFMVEALGFLVGQLQDLAGAIGESFVHGFASYWPTEAGSPPPTPNCSRPTRAAQASHGPRRRLVNAAAATIGWLAAAPLEAAPPHSHPTPGCDPKPSGQINMARPAIIVCEPTGLWAGALRRRWPTSRYGSSKRGEPPTPGKNWSMRPAACWPWPGRACGGPSWPNLPTRWADDFRWPAWLCWSIATSGVKSCWPTSWGPFTSCSSPRQVAAVAGLARRHLGPQPAAHWPAMDDAIDDVWQKLPWNSANEERIG